MLRFDVDADLIAAGQPSASDLQGLASEGVKTLVNLRKEGEANLPADWGEQVQAAGMQYVSIPIAGPEDINVDNARILAQAIGDGPGRVAVHCGSSNRVGALLALKAHSVDNMTPSDALQY
ncbi:MAG: sulfur transferase domain-containing protein, partial [Myxococcota bacterium]